MKLVRYESPLASLLGSGERRGNRWEEAFWPTLFTETPLHEDANNYFVRFEIPGMKKDELKVTLENGVLTVRGQKRIRENGKEGSVEVSRSVLVPDQIKGDAIEAKYEDGILDVTLPKREEVKPKEISIQVK